ncbi:MAG: hypothetical protein QOF14_4298 [Hyphomicrobiales bacterium]|jgi:predicted component of type VI protein secretion system|nr:hypothetical protein [Hyphomicrobiales bacterium]
MAPRLIDKDWAQIRHDYEHTDRPVEDICRQHGLSSGTLVDRVRRWGWTPRRAPIPALGPPPTAAPPAVPAPPTSLASATPADEPARAPPPDPQAEDPAVIGPRLRAALARVLPAIEAALARLTTSTHPRELDHAARTLAGLIKTLRELKALLSEYPVPDTEEDIEAFRAKLMHKIDGIIAQRHAAGDATDGQPEVI